MKKFNMLSLQFLLLFILLLVSSIASAQNVLVDFATVGALSNNKPIKTGETINLNDRLSVPKKAFLVLKFELGIFKIKNDLSIECTRRVFIQGEKSYVVENETTKNKCNDATKWDDKSLRRLKSTGSFIDKKTSVFVISEKSDDNDPLDYKYYDILKEKERNSLKGPSHEVLKPKLVFPTKPLPPPSSQNSGNSSQLTYSQALALYKRGNYSRDGISIIAPEVVENSLIVPLSVSTKLSNNQKLWVSHNDQHLVMTKNVSSKTLVTFKVRLKINKPGTLLVMAQNNNRIHAKSQRITITNNPPQYSNPKPVELNSWIRKLDRLKAANLESTSIKLRAKRNNNKLTIKLLIKHPAVENDFIEAIGLYLNNKSLSYTKFTPEVSQNPFLSTTFERVGKAGDVLKIIWIDNRGDYGLKSLVIK